MGKYVIATTKSWNIENANKLKRRYPNDTFLIISNKEELSKKVIERFNPEYIFFPHWSWIIKPELFYNYKCIVFHMTDLPYGRGGSPLQNLIVRGIYETKVSAIAVEKEIDTGPVYFKEPINISYGSADEILSRVSELVFEKMIPRFIEDEPVPVKQEGEIVTFKRRTPEESEIPEGLSQRQLYDYIRMLDGEGYPAAYKDIGDMRIYFKNAQLTDNAVRAETTIIKR